MSISLTSSYHQKRVWQGVQQLDYHLKMHFFSEINGFRIVIYFFDILHFFNLTILVVVSIQNRNLKVEAELALPFGFSKTSVFPFSNVWSSKALAFPCSTVWSSKALAFSYCGIVRHVRPGFSQCAFNV